MSYNDESGATPYNVLSDYGAIDILAKQKKLAPFMDSPFESVVKRNSNNRDKNTTNAVNFNGRRVKPTKGLRNTKPINMKAYLRRPVAFDKSPFEKQIRAKQNYFNIKNTRLDVDKYAEYLNTEMEAQNMELAKSTQQAQLFLPGILKKMTEHETAIKLGTVPKDSKPPFTNAEKAYLNMMGNLSPEDMFAKFKTMIEAQQGAEEQAPVPGQAATPGEVVVPDDPAIEDGRPEIEDSPIIEEIDTDDEGATEEKEEKEGEEGSKIGAEDYGMSFEDYVRYYKLPLSKFGYKVGRVELQELGKNQGERLERLTLMAESLGLKPECYGVKTDGSLKKSPAQLKGVAFTTFNKNDRAIFFDPENNRITWRRTS